MDCIEIPDPLFSAMKHLFLQNVLSILSPKVVNKFFTVFCLLLVLCTITAFYRVTFVNIVLFAIEIVLDTYHETPGPALTEKNASESR